MATQTKIAGTGANDSSVGSVAWSSPGAITADDGSFTGATLNSSLSNYLKGTNFGFTIPSIATITGIEVIVGDRGYLNQPVTDSAIRIVKGGTIGSTNNSAGATWANAGSATEVKTFGSSTDLWGETWTPSDINSSSFGAVIAAQGTAATASTVVDYISITVHYSLPGYLDAAFYSGLEVDKILGEPITGSFSVAASSLPGSAGNIVTETIGHDFGENVLPVMIFSDDNSSWQEAGSAIFNESTLIETLTATCYTTSTSVVIVAQNWTGSSITCHYKVMLVAET